VENALAASLLARHGGASIQGIREGLKKLSRVGPSHRLLRREGEREGLQRFQGHQCRCHPDGHSRPSGPLVVLLGGTDKGASYEPLRGALAGKLDG